MRSLWSNSFVVGGNEGSNATSYIRAHIFLCGLAVVPFLVGLVLKQPSVGLALSFSFYTIWSLLQLKRNLDMIPLFLSLISLSVLFPAFRLPSGLPNLRPEMALLAFGYGSIIVLAVLRRPSLPLRVSRTMLGFVAVAISVLVSIVLATLLNGARFIWRDLWEFVKIGEYAALFLLSSSLCIQAGGFRKLYDAILLIVGASAMVGILQYFDFLHMNQVAGPLYAPTQYEGLLRHLRVFGTTANPNVFGALLAFGSCLALSRFFFEDDSKRLVFPLATWLTCIAALVLSQSRSSLLAFGIGAITLGLRNLTFRHWSLRRRWLRLTIAVILGMAVMFSVSPESLWGRMWYALAGTPTATELAWSDPFTVGSITGRYDAWQNAVGHWHISPWYGFGPDKAAMTGVVVDCEWLLLLCRYGVLGLGAFLGLFIALHRRWKTPKGLTWGSQTAFQYGMRAASYGLAVYMCFAVVYHELQLAAVFFLCGGFAAATPMDDS